MGRQADAARATETGAPTRYGTQQSLAWTYAPVSTGNVGAPMLHVSPAKIVMGSPWPPGSDPRARRAQGTRDDDQKNQTPRWLVLGRGWEGFQRICSVHDPTKGGAAEMRH